MFRKLTAAILSVILLSPGWLGATGLTLPFALVPLLMDQLVVRRFAPFVAAHVRLGRADLRAVERRDGVVAMERHSRGARRRDARLDDAST